MNKKDDLEPITTKPVRIGLVDDHELFRAGIVSLLKDYPDYKVTLQAGNGKELLNMLRVMDYENVKPKKSKIPHVILLDIEMPELNGVQTLLELRKLYPDIRIIILSMHYEEGFIYEMMKKGVNGYLQKDRSVEELVQALGSVVSDGVYHNEISNNAMLHGINKQVTSEVPAFLLSENEIQIIQQICQQKTTREISESMGLSRKTIENVRATIMQKTKTKNTAGLVINAIKHKLLTDFLPL